MKEFGTLLLLSDAFMMEVITEVISVIHCLRNHVGRGSSSHDLLADCRIIDSMYVVLAPFSLFNLTPLNKLPEMCVCRSYINV